jgi:hypothetical protein
VSSDLSHHHTHTEAEKLDEATAASIIARRSDLSDAQACGAQSINGLLEVARRKNLDVRLLDRCTSGDAAGDSCRVVGYGSFRLSTFHALSATLCGPNPGWAVHRPGAHDAGRLAPQGAVVPDHRRQAGRYGPGHRHHKGLLMASLALALLERNLRLIH